MAKKKGNKENNLQKTIDAFNKAAKEDKINFANALNKALNFNPKKQK